MSTKLLLQMNSKENYLILISCFFLLFISECSKSKQSHPKPNPPETSSANIDSTFTNPLLPSGADPWVIYHNGYYYYMNTMGDRLVIWKTKDLEYLKSAKKETIWVSPEQGPYSSDIWAPELHFINGSWYVYFSADNGKNKTHRIYALKNSTSNPLNENWQFKGKIAAPSDKWAIDGSVFMYRNQLYMIWSGWPGNKNGQQNIYIAKMQNPWTIKGKRVKLSHPKYAWEKYGSQSPPYIAVNEGPEILKHNGDIFLIYSASGCWTDHYSLGMLTLKKGGNPMNSSDWTKSSKPVFTTDAQSHAYATGHCSFFKSPDGTETWIIYHANPKPHQGCGSHRSPRMQRIHWSADGTPIFGRPVPIGVPILKPSGGY